LFECSVRPWEDRSAAGGKILINCTSVGMWPDADASAMPAEALRPDTVVFDTVYRPQETRLLVDAAACGCTAVGGLGMFVRQAARQFEYWTQQPADYARILEVMVKTLGGPGMCIDSLNEKATCPSPWKGDEGTTGAKSEE
ncbi:MAG: hypothetical protein V3W34_06120, partial [Phycisphaerae bacterium]